jgi:hypothetical protein
VAPIPKLSQAHGFHRHIAVIRRKMAVAYAKKDEADSIAYIKKIRMAIVKLAEKSTSVQGVPADEGNEKKYYHALNKMLERFETGALQMTPRVRMETRINKDLKTIFEENPEVHFPDVYVQRAKALYEKFAKASWGQKPREIESYVEMEDDDGDSESAGSPSSSGGAMRRKSSAQGSKGVTKLPPPDHPIWGLDGIMHGVARRLGEGGTQSLCVNPAYKHLRKSAQVHGHNRILIGAWYPYRMVTLFHGAHGTSQAGISGDEKSGAYSIVVSGQYDDLDHDSGDVLYYSAPGSHENDDPRNLPEKAKGGAKALRKSIETGKPVRVLRTATGKSKYRPYVGIRYDGLYTVESRRDNKKNGRGGRYEQFKLVREEGQRELDEYHARVPTPQQLSDYNEIERTNTARWETWTG